MRHALADSGARALVTTRSTAPTAMVLAAELEQLEHVVVADVDSAPPER
jgi:hypothetical protein